MNSQFFISILAPLMDDFVAFRKSHGYDYNAGAATLWHFDRFLFRSGHDHHVITASILDRYALSMRHLAPNTQYGRLASVRVFARWLRRLIPESAVIDDIAVRRPVLPRSYLYSHEELASIIACARRTGGLRGACLATLFGLLYATGLRIGEALALNMGDIDLAGSRLTVRRGKLGKARNIVLCESTATALRGYLQERNAIPPRGPDAPVFTDTRGRRFSYNNVSRLFRSVLRDCGIGIGSACPPRLHDLRHTFACDCLWKWYGEGADVNARLPILATAMGHVGIGSTQIYLHVTSQLLITASGRFEATFTRNTMGADQ
jgi:integrase/recombinase XerD